MILDTFLGAWVTDDPEVMSAFLAQGHVRYAALQQACAPIKEAIEELQRDWQPREQHYWQNILDQLSPLRKAMHACRALFAREQNSEMHPLPMAFAANLTYRYGWNLNGVEEKIENAGILLTIQSATPSSLDEAHIRQRQRVLRALEALHEVVLKATTDARIAFDKEQRTGSYQSQSKSRQPNNPTLFLVKVEEESTNK